MRTVYSTFVNHPLFKDMKLEHLEVMSEGATELNFGPGQIIFRQGQPANAFYIIENGTVSLEALSPGQTPVRIQTLHAEAALGWSWLFPPFAWNFQARATDSCKLLALGASHLLAASQENEDFGYELMKRLSHIAIQRLQATRRKLLELKPMPSLPETLARGDASGWSKTVKTSMEAVALNHPFFDGLSPEHLKILADCGMQVQFKEGETIFREGETANCFYLIEIGKVALESHLKYGPAVPIQIIGKGDVLGWSWLFPPYYWNFDARAIEPTSAIFLYGTRLRENCETDHGLGLQLLKRMTKAIIHRLQSARWELLRLSSDSLDILGSHKRKIPVPANK